MKYHHNIDNIDNIHNSLSTEYHHNTDNIQRSEIRRFQYFSLGFENEKKYVERNLHVFFVSFKRKKIFTNVLCVFLIIHDGISISSSTKSNIMMKNFPTLPFYLHARNEKWNSIHFLLSCL